MICENCHYCLSFKVENGRYKIHCGEDDGTVEIHETNVERFKCPSYVEKEPEPEPPKDNVMIVLSCGRDFIVYDDRFHSDAELRDSFGGFGNGFIRYGQIWFKMSDIVALSYIGD